MEGASCSGGGKMMRNILALTFVGFSVFLFSCAEYKPKIKGMWQFKYGHPFALTCVKLEKKNPQEAKKATMSVPIDLNLRFLLKCGGFVDECHYKVDWYQVKDSGEKVFIKSQIEKVCK